VCTVYVKQMLAWDKWLLNERMANFFWYTSDSSLTTVVADYKWWYLLHCCSFGHAWLRLSSYWLMCYTTADIGIRQYDWNHCCACRLPFYYELKIVFVLWLLSPATNGSSILYRKFVHPQLSKREKVSFSLPPPLRYSETHKNSVRIPIRQNHSSIYKQFPLIATHFTIAWSACHLSLGLLRILGTCRVLG